MRTGTILFVDDEGDILKSLKRQVRTEPYESFFVQSGQEALDLLEKESIQVIVTDLHMPKMDGLSLLTRVEEKHPDIVRLVLSALDDKDSILDAINSGHVYRYILKPWDNTELKIIVRQAIERYQARKRMEVLSDLVENATHVMIFIVQPDGRIMECNALARSTFGYPKGEILNQNIGALFIFKADKGWEKKLDYITKQWDKLFKDNAPASI